MSCEGSKLLPRRQLPDLNGFVTTSAGNGFAVGAQRHRRDKVSVAGEVSKLLPRRHIPDLDMVLSSGDNAFPVGAQHHGRKTISMYNEISKLLPSRHVPDLDVSDPDAAGATSRSFA